MEKNSSTNFQDVSLVLQTLALWLMMRKSC